MKKYLVIIFIILLSGCSFKEDTKKYDLNIYLLYSSTCPHCHDEIEWLDKIKDKYKNIKIIKYEVSQNRELYEKVLKKMDIEDMYVPLTIIGSHYTVGFSDDIEEEIESYIKKYSKFESCDVINKVINNKEIDSCRDKNYKNLEN